MLHIRHKNSKHPVLTFRPRVSGVNFRSEKHINVVDATEPYIEHSYEAWFQKMDPVVSGKSVAAYQTTTDNHDYGC
jgi:hypothetical protein